MLISIDGEYVPRVGDEVSFRKLPLPPKMEKFQAVHVQVHKCREETLLLLIFITHHLKFQFQITNFTPEVHQRWESPLTDEENREGSRSTSPNK